MANAQMIRPARARGCYASDKVVDMTAEEVNERLGKLITEAVDDSKIVEILNNARLQLKILEETRKPMTFT